MGINTTVGTCLWLIKFLGRNPWYKNMAMTDVFCFSVPTFTCCESWLTRCQARWMFLQSCIYFLHAVPWQEVMGEKRKRKRETERESRSTVGNYDWPINRAGCQCQWAQLWTVGNSCGGTLLKRSSTVRSGHSPKVYMAEVTGCMVNTSRRE